MVSLTPLENHSFDENEIIYFLCPYLEFPILQKDDSIRELTDRLFFGADRFKAYVHEKTTPRPKPQVVTDNYYASARKTKYSTAARSNQWCVSSY